MSALCLLQGFSESLMHLLELADKRQKVSVAKRTASVHHVAGDCKWIRCLGFGHNNTL